MASGGATGVPPQEAARESRVGIQDVAAVSVGIPAWQARVGLTRAGDNLGDPLPQQRLATLVRDSETP